MRLPNKSPFLIYLTNEHFHTHSSEVNMCPLLQWTTMKTTTAFRPRLPTRRAQPLRLANSMDASPMPRPPSLSAADVNFPGSDYSFEELEFLRAMERYRRLNRRPFP